MQIRTLPTRVQYVFVMKCKSGNIAFHLADMLLCGGD
jgi:hypothetical protein